MGYTSGAARLPSSGSEYKLMDTFEFSKAVSDTVLDTIAPVRKCLREIHPNFQWPESQRREAARTILTWAGAKSSAAHSGQTVGRAARAAIHEKMDPKAHIIISILPSLYNSLHSHLQKSESYASG